MPLPVIIKEDIPYGARVLLRTTLNVPMQDGRVTGMFRIRNSLSTIKFLIERQARITLLSHLSDDTASFEPLVKVLNQHFPVSFLPHLTGEDAYTARDNLKPGEVLLLENTRKDSREKENDTLFAEELAANTDIFVFDDFSAAHRSHASTVGIMEYLPSYAGIHFYEEITALARITERLTKPAIAVLGGAKCETKIPIIMKLSEIYDTIFVGGVIANTLLKHRGYNVGASKVDDMAVPQAVIDNDTIVLPRDVIVTNDSNTVRTVPVEKISDDDIIVDIGSQTLETMEHAFKGAKTVVMNGPTGWYEKGFTKQTSRIVDMVKKIDAYTFAGGGDIVALLEQTEHLNDLTFISTGGGSLLAYLADSTLPVLESLRKNTKDA